MMQKFKKILSKHTTVIPVAFIVAILVAVTSFYLHKKNLDSEFSTLKDIPVSDISSSTTPAQNKDLTLAFPVGGKIKEVLVKSGDEVKAGMVLASLDSENTLGAINQAKAAYTVALNNYNKLLNGATNSEIQIARVSLTNAKNSYDTVVSQQKVLVSNALTTMMNSGLTAIPTESGLTSSNPTITGTYSGTEQGDYIVKTYQTGSGLYYSISGLENGGDSPVSSVAVALGKSGLYIQFPGTTASGVTWTISVPNKQSASYLTNSNAYNSALQTQSQVISNAKGLVDSAQAVLDQKVAGARSEDLDIAKAQVDSTKGALQIAEGAYNNTVITAPVDGKITSVSISAGQVAIPNSAVIELIAK